MLRHFKNTSTMPYTKRIVCLANSWKKGGACIAGVEILPNGSCNWVRPVSSRPNEELNHAERSYADGRTAAILDVIDIALLEHRPHACQVENHLTDSTQKWSRVQTLPARDLLSMPIVVRRGPLWIDGYSNELGENSKVPESSGNDLRSSLMLVAPDRAWLHVVLKPTDTGEKKQLRVSFMLGEVRYNLPITDTAFNAKYAHNEVGDYDVDTPPLLCISLSEPAYGYRFKLAAGIIMLDD
jgi:hypothetical protein